MGTLYVSPSPPRTRVTAFTATRKQREKRRFQTAKSLAQTRYIWSGDGALNVTTFGDLGVDPEVVWGEDIVQPPGEPPLLLLDPPLVIEHVLGSEWHRVPRDG